MTEAIDDSQKKGEADEVINLTREELSIILEFRNLYQGEIRLIKQKGSLQASQVVRPLEIKQSLNVVRISEINAEQRRVVDK